MRFHLLTTIVFVALVSYVHCGCEKKASSEENDSGESDVGQFFKNIGCDIKKGADKISETAKPWVDEIGKSAKKFGGSVAGTFSDLKDKITGTPDNSTVKADTTSSKPADSTPAPSSSSSATPEAQTPSSLDDRILLDVDIRCPDGKQNDGRGHCRSIA